MPDDRPVVHGGSVPARESTTERVAERASEPERDTTRGRERAKDRTKGDYEVVIERYGYGDDMLVEGDRVSDGDTPYDLKDAEKSGAVRKVPKEDR